jgi:hypothetical protein
MGKTRKGGTSTNMSKQAKQQEMLHRLRSLVHQPDEQVQYALEILERERGKQVVSLDRVVAVTGYARKYTIQLLNHVPKRATRTYHPRQPIYGSAVQEALFLAWRTIQYSCAKRLVPFLPKLIPVLERDGHLQFDGEQRRQ